MAVLAVGDFLRARICCYSGSQIGLNITHWRVTATGGAPTEGLVALGLDNQLATFYKGMMSSLSRWRGVGVSRIQPLPTTEVASIANDGAGVSGTTNLPLQMSSILGIYDGGRGRSHRGRLYVPFPSASEAGTAGVPTGAHAIAMSNLGTSLLGGLTVAVGLDSITAELCILHGHPPAATVSKVVQFKVPLKFAAQHKRGQYGKLNALPF